MRFGENREWQTEKELMKILCIAPFKGLSLVAQMVESAYNAGDLGSIPGSGRSPGEGNGNPLQYLA